MLRKLACGAMAALVLASGAQAAKPVQEPSQGFRFQFVTGDDSALTQRITEDLYKRLVPIFAGFRTELAQHRRMLYVAIGPAALREVASKRCDCVVISAFTSSQVYRSIMDQAARGGGHPVASTAVYAEPAPADQLRLAALLYRRPVRVSAILGADTAFLRPALEAGKVAVLDAAAGDDINRLLNQIAQTDVLLALPDSAVFTTESIRNILLSTYRHKQGVIGFSGDMVKAGALATTYSEIEDIDAQVAEIAGAYVAGGELAPPQFPRYFRTIVNEGVARSLDLTVGDEVRSFSRRAADPAPARRP
ncbi:hypothetical protein AB595_26580 [Massilia sp. WF1]|uniref:hypothetical protein n=1 Tax=unclassified Massilia TaxID=2609279 RepID=UPI00068A78BE|nr:MULTISPECIES: hypothetical protein [unclassified Massilia]ALK95319.1 hypothetical protein AM586_02460 [Massilia sp. WG5]KNZ67349.1 hypothetical protein AB595_26580 [Massilia sp. WF1]